MAPSGKRGGGSSKKQPKTALEPDEGSHIVFTNAKDDAKSNKKKKTNAAADNNGSASAGPSTDPNTPKKPDTRTLIGGSSWTGKLPVNMLSEHCQKQKWEKPEYTMTKTPEGFVSSVILKSVNPKTREAKVLPPMRLPAERKGLAAQETAVEARHFAAAYALFRVSSLKNIHMMMPPTYRDLWKGAFTEMKKEDEGAGKGWLYAADPFAMAEEMEVRAKKVEKEREKVKAERAKEAARPAAPGAKAPMGDKNVMRGWVNAPKVEMGRRLRELVEEMVRRNVVWNPSGIRIERKRRDAIVDDLVKIGFRKSHVEEALEECKDKEEALEWLLVHVPDDDLPPWSLPEGYAAGISIASGDLKREAAIKRLAASGYALSACEKAMDECKGDEDAAAGALQKQLLAGSLPDIGPLQVEDPTTEEAETTWLDEMETLASIYDKQFRQISSKHCTIELEVEGLKERLVLHVRRPSRYPQTLPIISIDGRLPAHIRLSTYKQALATAQEAFLGQPMIFSIIDWLQVSMPNIIENPGKLRDVAAAAAILTDETTRPKPSTSKRTNAYRELGPSQDSAEVLQNWRKRQETAAQRKMLQARQSLPAWKLRDALVATVNENQVTIISGETGSGKSTQSVQFVLDDLIQKGLGGKANIICTQPRRISALGLADRVSDERCSTVGDEVGYTIRGESKRKAGVTKITFVTTGVLLRRLQTSGGSTDDVVASLADVSHVVVDEVHERSLDTDFLLILLRDVLAKRKDLKVLLMSATLDAQVFENYFSGQVSVGKVEISGRTFPVEDLYLDDVISMTNFTPRSRRNWDDDEDDAEVQANDKTIASVIQNLGMRINYDLIVSTVKSIDAELGLESGGILIFLPGTAEISRTVEALNRVPELHALPLHASLTPLEQKRVFPPAPKGKRKVIAATNVAETSITIEDIVAVIDTGKVKETSFDSANNMVKLEEVWASRAACKQRRGRAGRVREGTCYKLYTRKREEEMPERPDPEIRRVPLEQLCLSVRAMGIVDVPMFLASALTPPEVSAVEGALQVLTRMGALIDGNLSALGHHLSMIPADLRCAKLMVYGALFGCLEATLTVAGVLTARSPFLSPQTAREEAKASKVSFSGGQGDLVADLKAFTQWNEMRRMSGNRDARRWCEDRFLSHQTLMDISTNRTQYLSSLKDAGFLPFAYRNDDTSPLNVNNANYSLLRAVIAGAFHPQLAEIRLPDTKFAASASGAVALDPEAKTIRYYAEGAGNRVFVHPSSTSFEAQGFPGNSVYMSYFSKIATSKVFIRDLTPFNAYSLLMFGGEIKLDTMGRGLVVDGWLRLRGWARIGVLVSRLRGMLDQLLEENLEDPSGAARMARSEVVGLVRRLVEFDGMDR